MIAYSEERGGMLRRIVQLNPEPAAVLAVWDRAQTCPNMFGALGETSIAKMIAEAWKFWTVDDVGLLCFDPVGPFAHVHVTFWDRRLRGREGLCRHALYYLMKIYGVSEVRTAIPLRSRATLAFAKRVGLEVISTSDTHAVLRGTLSLSAEAV